MEICTNHNNDPIAHTGWECPACMEIAELEKEHETTVNDLEQQISEADDRIVELESEVATSGPR